MAAAGGWDLDDLVDFGLNPHMSLEEVWAVLALYELDQNRQEFRRDFSLDDYTEQQCIDHFRFSSADLVHLYGLFRFPERVSTPNRVHAPGLEVFCIVLKRLAYPTRYTDLQEFFRRPQRELCMFFLWGIDFLMTNFGSRLTDWDQPWLTNAKLLDYCAAVHASGAPLPQCWGFVDGTVRKLCRPIRLQQEVYNGHKRIHAIKFQSVVSPNGLIVHLFGPLPGRRHDAYLLNQSGILDHFEATASFYAADGTALYLYGDAAYPLRPHLQKPFLGANLTPQQTEFNRSMSSARMAVEWEFGKVVELWAFVDFEKNLKLLKSPVGNIYFVAVLLTNCHTCIYGNQTSRHFGLTPPTVAEYLY